MMQIWKRILGWFKRDTLTARPSQEVAAPSPPSNEPIVSANTTETALSPERKQARQEARRIVVLRRKIADETNLFLETISNLRLKKLDDSRGWRDARESCSFLANDFIDLRFAEQMPGGGKWLALPTEGEEAEFARTIWPIEIGVVTRSEEDDTTRFTYILSAEPRDLRGKINIVPRQIVVVHHAYITKKVWWAEKYYAGLVSGKWRLLDNNMMSERWTGMGSALTVGRRQGRAHDEVNEVVSMLFSIALTHRYYWHVALGCGPEGTRIVLPTNPTSCLEFFRDRNAIGHRRKALRHWVGNHFRNAEKDICYVRDHLRGTTNFNWHGLQCELMVSEFDLEKNEAFRLEAEQWRSRRGHNRIRVKIKK